jgi:hypothetical protein
VAETLRLNLIDRCRTEGPEAHGSAEFRKAAEHARIGYRTIQDPSQADGGLLLVIGNADGKLVRGLARENGIELPLGEESAVFQELRSGSRRILLISGGGEAGLMYALLELTERLRHEGASALLEPRPFSESPELAVRGVNRFIMGPLDDEWFLSDEFWLYFLDNLARCRLNRFVFITGYDSAYMSPPYSYFVRIPGADSVKVRGLTDERRESNLARLRKIGALCADRGIEFFLGIWQQLPFETGQGLLVEGLPADEVGLAAYCAKGLREILVRCPEIRGLHLRVNFEAGVGTQTTAEAFWNSLTDEVASCGRKVKLDLRAKGLTDGMISHALGLGLDLSVPTKYWCEQTGLPHHMTQMRSEELSQLDNLNHSRRYSYGNLLKRPRRYDMIYRLWNLGATNLFVWGDPDWTRRFCASMAVGEALGFEFASPLSLKGGHFFLQKDPWQLFDDKSMVGYRFEDERYWYQYLLFGRIGYSERVEQEVFRREFSQRFGTAAGKEIARAYAVASRVIPLITASHMPVHPMEQYWPELTTGGALFQENQLNAHYRENTYGATEPSDSGLFYGIEEYARDSASGSLKAKYTPLQVAALFAAFSAGTRAALAAAAGASDLRHEPEYAATVLDFSMIADLADYHASKIEASLALARFKLQGNAAELRRCAVSTGEARAHWARLAQRGTGTYHKPLEFGAGTSTGRTGHWADQLVELDRDLATLRSMAGPDVEKGTGTAGRDTEPVRVETHGRSARVRLGGLLESPTTAIAGEKFRVAYHPDPFEVDLSPILRYRRADQTEGPFKSIPMEWSGDCFEATVDGSYIIQEFDLLLYVAVIADAETTLMAPGLYHPDFSMPYLFISVVEGRRAENR